MVHVQADCALAAASFSRLRALLFPCFFQAADKSPKPGGSSTNGKHNALLGTLRRFVSPVSKHSVGLPACVLACFEVCMQGRATAAGHAAPCLGGRVKQATRLHATSLRVLFPQVLLEAFTLTFLAEWGDRSQIATIGAPLCSLFCRPAC